MLRHASQMFAPVREGDGVRVFLGCHHQATPCATPWHLPGRSNSLQFYRFSRRSSLEPLEFPLEDAASDSDVPELAKESSVGDGYLKLTPSKWARKMTPTRPTNGIFLMENDDWPVDLGVDMGR